MRYLSRCCSCRRIGVRPDIPLCSNCARTLREFEIDGLTPRDVGAVRSLYSWESDYGRSTSTVVRDLVHAMKGDGEPANWRSLASRFLARQMSFGFGEVLRNELVIVPIPPRKEVKADHASGFSIALSRLLDAPVFLRALARREGHLEQKEMDVLARDSVSFARGEDTWPRGPRICLVDDVITTGATISAALSALAIKNPNEVEIWTLANRPRLRGEAKTWYNASEL